MLERIRARHTSRQSDVQSLAFEYRSTQRLEVCFAEIINVQLVSPGSQHMKQLDKRNQTRVLCSKPDTGKTSVVEPAIPRILRQKKWVVNTVRPPKLDPICVIGENL